MTPATDMTPELDVQLQSLLEGSRRRIEAINSCGRIVAEEGQLLDQLNIAVNRTRAARRALMEVLTGPEDTPARQLRRVGMASRVTATLMDMRKPGGPFAGIMGH